MFKVSKIFQEKKKTLFLIGLGLVLVFFPLSFIESQFVRIQAHDQEVETYQNSPITIILEGDSQIHDFPNLYFYIEKEPSRGTLDVSAGEKISVDDPYVLYTPDADYLGEDFFTFYIDDDDERSFIQKGNTATVTIEVVEFAVNEWCPDCSPLNPLACLWCLVVYIVSLPARLGFFILILPLTLLALFSGYLFSITIALTNWMISIALKVGITPGNPATPEIVNIGWTFTRDFINMFFILILVFIGLATILKLREYEAKKTLPKLIFVALLINFTPVIVGFVVDMGNIITNFFLVTATGMLELSTEVLKMAWNYFTDTLIYIFTADGTFLTNFGAILNQMVGIVVYGIVLIGFFLLGAWIYFWVMLVFFMRIVMLWILMILAPIAFFSQVLPPSKTVKMVFPSILHWDKWWEELLQWVVVGIPLGFFLYLSNWIMINTSDIEGIFNPEGILQEGLREALNNGWAEGFIGLIITMLAPLVALAILHRGYKIAKETAPAAATGIIDGVKKLATGAVVGGLTGGLAGAAASGLRKTTAATQKLEQSAEKVPVIGTPLKYGVGKPISWATRGIESIAAPSLLRHASRARKVKIPEGFENMTSDEQQQLVRAKAFTPGAKVQYGVKMKELGTLGETTEEFKDSIGQAAKKLAGNKYYNKYVDEIRKALPDKVTARLMIDFEIDQRARDDMEKKIKDLSMTQGITEDSAAKRILVSKMKTEDVSKIATKDIHLNQDIMEGSMHWGGGQLSKAPEKFGPNFINRYAEMAEEKNTHWFLENNPAGLFYLSGNAAQDYGYTVPEGLDRSEVNSLAKWYRDEKRKNREKQQRTEESRKFLGLLTKGMEKGEDKKWREKK